MLIPLGILASAGGVPPIISDYELISTTVLPSNAANVTFDVSTFASTYKHLQVRAVSKNTGNQDGLVFQLNGVATASYAVHSFIGNGSTVSSSAFTGRGEMWNLGMSTSTTANAFGVGVIDFLDAYSTTKNKTVRSLSGFSDSGRAVGLYSGVFLSTASITSIAFFPFLNQIAAGSRFSLYGIKG
jgi:hypothetical protein